ncbi:MAG: carbohydrate ABC transporter permease [Provencibacterium sp.]|nr:carbohydrate ABC transporter permease [Provencibacterium sp.]
MDAVILVFLTVWAISIILPFVSVIAISFATPKEYLESPLLLFPTRPTLANYRTLFADGRILIGYRTTLIILLLGVPINMFLTTSVAFALSRPAFPLKKFFLYAVMFTMLFHGGIVPLYLLMMELKLTNSIWSVILAYGVNTFYMIVMRSYFQSLPDSLMESARLDGAGEWRILFQIVLPLSMPIIATILLFYSVDRWNEWFNAMIFLRRNSMVPLQLVLRSMVLEATAEKTMMASSSAIQQSMFSDGLKMSAVIVTMLPIMCVFPFLQKYFVKGILIGAVKA